MVITLKQLLYARYLIPGFRVLSFDSPFHAKTRKALGLCVKGAGGLPMFQLEELRLPGLKRLVQSYSKLMWKIAQAS